MESNSKVLDNAVSIIRQLIERVRNLEPNIDKVNEDYLLIKEARDTIYKLNVLSVSMKMPKEKAIDIVKRQIDIMQCNEDFETAEALEILLDEVTKE